MSFNVQGGINPTVVDQALIQTLTTATPNSLSRLSHLYNRASGIFLAEMPVTVTYISDNGNYADAARAEIQKRLCDINATLSGLSGRHAPDVIYQDIPSQDWRAGAFDLAQLARDTVRGPGNILFVNCAPRLKQRGHEKENKGEGVYIGMLRNGTIVSAVSEHSFALFRDLVERKELELYAVNVQTKGSQFRSRDFFTWFTELLAFNMRRHAKDWKSGMDVEARKDLLSRLNFVDTGKSVDLADIPDLSKTPQILRTDTHGNLKLSMRSTDVSCDLMKREHEFSLQNEEGIQRGKNIVRSFQENMFDTKSGEIGIAPGSSGNWPDYAAPNSRFLEVALIGANLRKEWGLTDQEIKEGLYMHIRDAQTGNVYPFAPQPING